MRKKQASFTKVDLKHIRIEARDLVNIVREIAGDKLPITAESEDYEFESIKEIENNLPALQGRPSFNIGPINLDFERSDDVLPPAIYLRTRLIKADSNVRPEEYDRIVANLELRLNEYRTFFASFWNRLFFWQAFGIICAIVAVFLFKPDDPVGIVLLALAAYLPATFMLDKITLRLIGEGSVVYSERDGFFKRNADKIATSVVTAIIVSMVIGLYSELASRLNGESGVTSEDTKAP